MSEFRNWLRGTLACACYTLRLYVSTFTISWKTFLFSIRLVYLVDLGYGCSSIGSDFSSHEFTRTLCIVANSEITAMSRDLETLAKDEQIECAVVDSESLMTANRRWEMDGKKRTDAVIISDMLIQRSLLINLTSSSSSSSANYCVLGAHQSTLIT